jgi:hypothetical protein
MLGVVCSCSPVWPKVVGGSGEEIPGHSAPSLRQWHLQCGGPGKGRLEGTLQIWQEASHVQMWT